MFHQSHGNLRNETTTTERARTERVASASSVAQQPRSYFEVMGAGGTQAEG